MIAAGQDNKKSGACFPSALSGLYILRHTAKDYYVYTLHPRLLNLSAE